MTVTFDLFDGDTKIKTGISSPIVIDGLTPNMEYSNYSVAYTGKSYKTPLSFKTKAPVNIPVTGVTVLPKTLTMQVGDTESVIATIMPENATNQKVSFSSENGTVVIINLKGVITAVGAGTGNILVTTEDGNFYDKTAVTVTNEGE